MVMPRELAPYFNWGWKKAVEIGNKLLDIADDLEKKKLYRFAEQVRGASLSISNNTCPVK